MVRFEKEEGSSTVTMYCTPWCPDCAKARAWLDKHGIEYVEIDVSNNIHAREKAAAYNEGRLHTPTFEVGDDICIDFKPDELETLLGMKPE